MRTELSAITATFPGSEWQDALAAFLRTSQIDQQNAGRRLHDEVGQDLSALGLQLSLLLLDFQNRVPELTNRVTEIQALLEKTIVQVREISGRLNPSTVDRTGLRYSLETLLAQQPGQWRLEYASDLRVPREVARALFCVAPYCFEYAGRMSAGEKRIRVIQEEFGAVLEVLYDGNGSQDFDGLKATHRLTLLLLHCHAIGAGVRVVFEDLPGRISLIRASYSAKDSGL